MSERIWFPDGCRKVAEAHDEMAAGFRRRGEEGLARWCDAWAAWYRDRAEGKPGEDTLPEVPSRGQHERI
jgi:hypothetical protein